jgi:hypothetical protein
MSSNSIERAQGALSKLLCGTTLDSIRAYSVVVQLGFFRSDDKGDLPREVWLTTTGSLRLIGANDDTSQSLDGCQERNFFEQRANVLKEIYMLIGKSVSSININMGGNLNIELGGKTLVASPDSENYEEVWAVMSDTPAADQDHQWYVGLDDTYEMIVRMPESESKDSGSR